MLKRRLFVKKAMLAAVLGSSGAWACNEPTPRAETQRSVQNEHSKAGLPIVIATWKNDQATTAAMNVLTEGRTALDAVEAGARVPEADPNDRSVGYGGRPDREGIVTLDACIMDHTGRAGSVAFLQDIKHPISVARKVMELTPHVMLVGEGAKQFALENGFTKENLLTDSSSQEWEAWRETSLYQPKANIERHDTIGILAIDAQGRISGACTTSGMAYKMHGRVGDSPIIGAGLFVDGDVGGACATGQGELILTTLGAFLIVELMRQGLSPQAACEEGVRRIVQKYGTEDKEMQVGYLAINKAGEHGAYSLRAGFAYTCFQHGANEVFESGHQV